MQQPHLVLSAHFASRYAGRLHEAAADARLITHHPDGAWDSDPAAAEAVYLSSDMWRTPMARTVLTEMRGWSGLRWVHTSSAGVDLPGFGELLARGVSITNAAGVNGGVIAQHVLALMLSHARRLPELREAQEQRQWRRLECSELTGATAVIVGLGGIGAAVARLCSAFGMHVCGVRRGSTKVAGVDVLAPPQMLPEWLPRADYLVLACPLTDATRGLIDARSLALLPQQAYLINVARGPVVDAAALNAALRAGQIAGAALDVFDHEPLPDASPLWTAPHLTITPHIAGSSPHNPDRNARFFLDNLGRWVRGEPLLNRVTSID